MARDTLIERHEVAGRVYEVRRVGRATCLYTNGVLHTSYDETAIVSGRVWDLLALPGLVSQPKRVLVLGVGGGAAIRQLLTFAAPAHVDGVDLDAVHLDMARRHFGLGDPRVHLHHADARDFVKGASGRYDLVVDDVFGEFDGEPRRAIAFDRAWGEALGRLLEPQGVLVVNNAGEREVRGSALTDPEFVCAFATVLSMTTESAGNVVFGLFREAMNERTLRSRAKGVLGEAAARLDMKVRTRV